MNKFNQVMEFKSVHNVCARVSSTIYFTFSYGLLSRTMYQGELSNKVWGNQVITSWGNMWNNYSTTGVLYEDQFFI